MDDCGIGDEEVLGLEGCCDLTSFYAMVDNSLSQNTRTSYNNRLKRIRSALKEPHQEESDVALEELPAKKILKFVEDESVHPNGKLKSASTPDGYRSALVYHFYKTHKDLPREISIDLQKFVKGVKGKIAEGRRSGEYKATEGRDVLSFETLREVCKATIADDYSDGHLFLLFSWALTCRSDTTQNINFSCIRWDSDCITVVIPKSKTMQQGAMRGETHEFKLYANPLQEEICVFLALGIKLLTTSILPASGTLYRETEYTHFSAWLKKQFENWCAEQSLDPQQTPNYGPHSIKKGSLSWILSFPGAVSAVSGMLRAGYTLGGVLPRYVALILQGDQNVGRALSGLPIQSSDFSMLPARFKSIEDINWCEFVCDYKQYPGCFVPCIPYLVAAVVHHRAWLVEHLPDTHKLFSSRFWRNGYQEKLASRILAPTRMSCSVTGMRASGVSQLTVVLDALDEVKATVAKLTTPSTTPMPAFLPLTPAPYTMQTVTPGAAPGLDAATFLPSQVVPVQLQLLSPSPVTAPPAVQVTTAPIDAQHAALQAQMAQMNATLAAVLQRLETGSALSTTPATSAVHTTSSGESQFNQAVTSSFVYPKKLNLRQLHELWYDGNPTKSTPPLRTIPGKVLDKTYSKYVTYAKECVSAIDKHLPTSYFHSSAEDKDAAFRIACTALVNELKTCNHPSDVPTLKDGLASNSYASVYSNDLSYIRKKKK